MHSEECHKHNAQEVQIINEKQSPAWNQTCTKAKVGHKNRCIPISEFNYFVSAPSGDVRERAIILGLGTSKISKFGMLSFIIWWQGL